MNGYSHRTVEVEVETARNVPAQHAQSVNATLNCACMAANFSGHLENELVTMSLGSMAPVTLKFALCIHGIGEMIQC